MFERLRVSDSFLLKNNLREILFRKPADAEGRLPATTSLPLPNAADAAIGG